MADKSLEGTGGRTDADERIITIDDVTEGKKASRWLRANAVSL